MYRRSPVEKADLLRFVQIWTSSLESRLRHARDVEQFVQRRERAGSLA
jgi:hypothetical protein